MVTPFFQLHRRCSGPSQELIASGCTPSFWTLVTSTLIFGKKRSKIHFNRRNLFLPRSFISRIKENPFLGFSPLWVLLSLVRKTALRELLHSMWIPKNPLQGNLLWNKSMWAYSTYRNPCWGLPYSYLVCQIDSLAWTNSHLLIIALLQHSPLASLHCVLAMPCIRWLLSLVHKFELIEKLASHMLSIFSVFPDYWDVQDQIRSRWNR